MPYKPTGRPPGRPKTNWYETLSARVPQDLADQVRKYAGRKRQTLSDVFRDGFTLLLQEDRYAPFTSDTDGAHAIMSDTIPPETMPDIMSDTNMIQNNMSDTIHQQRLREIVYDMNDTSGIVCDTNGAPPRPLDAVAPDVMPLEPMDTSQQPLQPTLDYDATKYALGKLCPRGHDYQGTGQTLLLLPRRRCLACENERKREQRQAKRQAVGV